jgi:hypothetical protein
MLAIDGAISTHANVHNIRLRPGWRLRIELKRTGIFTFLDYDGVPWNNNNAEHAVRAFTRLRTNAIGTSTPKGTREHVTLLIIQRTLRYRGKSFLEFIHQEKRKFPANLYKETAQGRARRRRAASSMAIDLRAFEKWPDTISISD